jgi:hypothetical protein
LAISPNQLTALGGTNIESRNVSPVAENCDAIADLEDLIETVRYVNDGDTLFGQPPNRREEFPRLTARQR